MVKPAPLLAQEGLLWSDEPVFSGLHISATMAPLTLADAPEYAVVFINEPFGE